MVTIASFVTGAEIAIVCCEAINAMDMLTNISSSDDLSDHFDVYAVGDCADPWDIQAAVATGNLAARAC